MPDSGSPSTAESVDADRAAPVSSASDGKNDPSADIVDGAASDANVLIQIPDVPSPRSHVIVWLVGVLLSSLIPLTVIFFHGLDAGKTPSIFKLLGHGDLLLISLVVTIAGITEIALAFRRIHPAQSLPVALLVLGAVLVIAAEALWYADVTARLLDKQSFPATHSVTYGSIGLFLISSFCSSACVSIAAGTR